MLKHAPTADDLRAALSYHRKPIYIVAAAVGVHPVRLSKFLNGRLPLKPDLAERIRRAIDES